MTVGHGTLGLLDRLRTFADLQADPGAHRRPYLELELGMALGPNAWTTHAGSVYKTPLTSSALELYGQLRAVVGVQTAVLPRALTRVERLTDVVAGTFYVDDDALAGGSTDLYARLPDSSDPDATTVMLLLLFAMGSRRMDAAGRLLAEVHPIVGSNKLPNGGLESWTGGNPDGVTEVGTGATQETSIVARGSSSGRIVAAGAGGSLDGIQWSVLGVQGAMSRFSGYYRTPSTNDPEVEARVRVGTAGVRMLSDGRNLTTDDNGLLIRNTADEWATFLFDLAWPAATTTGLEVGVFLKNTAGVAKAGTLYVDGLAFTRIWRFVVYQSLIQAASIPELEIMSQSILFGGKTIAIGSVTLADGDGELAATLAKLLIMHRTARVYVGGSFVPSGAEVLSHDWRPQFPARTRTPSIVDGAIELELNDSRMKTRMLAAPRVLRRADSDTADAAPAAEGLTKPLLFGTPAGYNTGGIVAGPVRQHILPGRRVGVTANGFGEYEYLDRFIPVRDNVDVDMPTDKSLKVYPTEEHAREDRLGYEITDATNDFTLINNKTRWRILRDLRNYRYDRAGNDVGTGAVLSFGIGSFEVVTGVNDKINAQVPAGAQQTATLTAGKYTGAGLAAEAEARLDAIAALGDFSVTYSATTGFFTITYNGGGDIELLTFSGANAATSALRLLMGFTQPPVIVTDRNGNDCRFQVAPQIGTPGASEEDWLGRTSYTSNKPGFGMTIYTATLDIEGPAWKVAADVQAALRAAAGAITTIAVTYSESTHKFTVTYSGTHAIFALLMKNPTAPAELEAGRVAEAPQKQSWKILGYDTRTDKAGAASYVSDVPTFTDADQDHVIRFWGGGYRDDASGSICGVANAAIDSGPAIASWLLQKGLEEPERVDVPSFKAAREESRSADFAILAAYLESGDLADALVWLGQASRADFVIGGDEVWVAKQLTESVAGAREFYDHDYIAGTWQQWRDPTTLYKAVRVLADYNPSLKRFKTFSEATGILDPKAMTLKYGAEEILDIPAFLERQYSEGGTQRLSTIYGRLIARTPGRVAFASRAKLGDLLIGDKVITWRSRAFDPTGTAGLTPAAVSTSSVADPTVIATAAPHYLVSGNLVRIVGHAGSSPAIAGDYRVIVTGPTTFTIPVTVTVGGSGGTFVKVPVHRIVGLRLNALTGIGRCWAVEDIGVLTG